MLQFLLAGAAFGLAAGVSPGPLLALVIAQTLRYGPREGVKTAFAPLVSDGPIILVSLFVLSRLSGAGPALAVIGIGGGLFTAALGFESLRVQGVEAEESGAPRSFLKAVTLNLLNPHVYFFWGTVGAPMVLRGMDHGAVAFVMAFYACLVGSKVLVAMLLGRSRHLLSGRGYLFTMRVLGIVLFVIAAGLLWDGVRRLAAML